MATTKIIKLDPINLEEKYLQEAADILKSGGLVIIPTETVYGIAANMLDQKAVERLTLIKKRPKDKPFSLHIAEKEKLEDFAQNIPIAAYKLIDRFWPGPLTLIFKAKSTSAIGSLISLSTDGATTLTIGIRMPDNPVALKIISLAGVPIVLPSANLSGLPAPRDFKTAITELDGLVDLAIDTGETKLGVESSVVDLTTEPLRVLREEAIKKREIEAAAEKKIVLFVCTGNSCRSVMAEALLKKKLKESNRQNVEVSSAGMALIGGLGATEETKEVLRKEGIDVSGHYSRAITRGMLKKSDIILVMEKIHEEKILQFVPEVKNRVFLLKEFAKISENNLDIADPIGKGRKFYEDTFRTIKRAVERISKLI